jgi:hypothetical protein
MGDYFFLGRKKMKIHSISENFFTLCSFDKELVFNTNRRPHLIVKNIIYKDKRQTFAIPLRSNIKAPERQYFSLPPTSRTENKRAHGIHYIKMFPIKKEYLEPYFNSDKKHKRIVKIIKRNTKTIVKETQKYVKDYEKGNIHRYSTDIENIYYKLTNN